LAKFSYREYETAMFSFLSFSETQFQKLQSLDKMRTLELFFIPGNSKMGVFDITFPPNLENLTLQLP